MPEIASRRGEWFGWLNRLSPQAVFLLIAGVFATALALITPPMQVPDEPAHWMRTYQLSQGRFVAADHCGDIPISVGETIHRFMPLAFHPEAKTSFEAIGQEFRRPLQARITHCFPFENTTLYTVVPYAPQTLLMLIARKLDWPPVALLYAGRFGAVLGYLLLGWGAIRLMPILKWPACLILTSPVGLFLAGSLSADAITIGVLFLAIALVLRCVFSSGNLSAGIIVALLGVMIGVALCKSAYFPVSFLVFAIPAEKWGAGKRRWIWLVVIILVSLGVVGGWSVLAKAQQVRELGDDPARQLSWILHHPAVYAAIFCRSLATQFVPLVYSGIGVLGWLDTPMPPSFLQFYLVCLAWVTLNYDQPLTLGLRPRGVAAMVLGGCAAVIVTANYLVWDKIGQSPIQGVQRRYFLPVALLVCAIFHRKGRYPVQPKWMVGLMTVFSLLTVWILLRRYYFSMA